MFIIEVEVHFVDELVGRVGQPLHAHGVGCPIPRRRIPVAFYEDKLLGGTSIADTVNRGLVKPHDGGVAAFPIVQVVFIVGVEDDLRFSGEVAGEGMPEGGKVVGANNGATNWVPPAIPRHKHGVGARVVDGTDGVCKVAEVGSIDGAGDGAGVHAFHDERDAKDIIALLDKGLQRGD